MAQPGVGRMPTPWSLHRERPLTEEPAVPALSGRGEVGGPQGRAFRKRQAMAAVSLRHRLEWEA